MYIVNSMEILQEKFISILSVYFIRRLFVGKFWFYFVYIDDFFYGFIVRISIRRNGFKVWRLVIISNFYNFKNKQLIYNKKIIVFKIRGVFIYM